MIGKLHVRKRKFNHEIVREKSRRENAYYEET